MTSKSRTPTSSPPPARRSARRRAACSATPAPTTCSRTCCAAWSRRRRASTPTRIDDVIIGCAMPEAEQGMNVARIGVLLAGLPDSVAAQTINRFCSSGLQAVALAADRIRLGDADLMLAGGTESMSMVPMMGNKVALNAEVFAATRTSPSPTAWASPPRRSPSNGRSRARTRMPSRSPRTRRRSRRSQAGEFTRRDLALRGRSRTCPTSPATRSRVQRSRWSTPTKARARTRRSKASPSCKPVFRNGQFGGTVTAGNSSQMSDGAGGGAAGVRTGDQGLRPDAAGALRRLRGRRRAPGGHGHRPDRGDPEGAEAGRHDAATSSTGSSSTKPSPRRRWR